MTILQMFPNILNPSESRGGPPSRWNTCLLMYPWIWALAAAWRGVWPAASRADVRRDSRGQSLVSPPSLVISHQLLASTRHWHRTRHHALLCTRHRGMEWKILNRHDHVHIYFSMFVLYIIQHFICLSFSPLIFKVLIIYLLGNSTPV